MAEHAKLFMLLKDAGDTWIKGEASDKDFADQIVLDDWNWNLGRKKSDDKLGGTGGASAPGVGAALGKIAPSVLSLSKRMCRATPVMLSMMESGKLCKAKIQLEEASDADFEMAIELDDIRIIEYEIDGEVEDKFGELKEKWVFNYKKIKFTYLPSKTGDSAAARGARVVEFSRDPGDSTDKPGGQGDEQDFKRLAQKLGQKTAKTLFDAIDWKAPAEAKADFKNQPAGDGKDI